MIKNGVYTIKDEFYEIFTDDALTHNKGASRPFFYCIEDELIKDLYWFVPMTSKVEKLKIILAEKFNNDEDKCDFFVINSYGNKPSAFLTIDVFPIIKKFVERKYEIKSEHYIVKNKKIIAQINKKAKKIIGLKNKGIKLTPKSIDIIKIKRELEIILASEV